MWLSLDPKPVHHLNLSNLSLITPNRKEAFELADLPDETKNENPLADKNLMLVAERLLNELRPALLLITLGELGMLLCQRGQKPFHIPTVAQEVFDVSGAGDTVIATFTLAIAAGASPVEAAILSNHAAGIVVGKVGTATTTPEIVKVFRTLKRYTLNAHRSQPADVDHFTMKITVETIRAMKARGEKIAALTAYDFPMAKLLDEAGVPLLLVGDSLGMVVLGYPDTTHVTMAEMEHHVRAAARAKPNALLGGDLPFKSYETVSDAVANAKRLVAAGAEFVKAEGGRGNFAASQSHHRGGNSVLRSSGHVAAARFGRRRLSHQRQKGRGTSKFARGCETALADAGAFAIVLELVTPPVAKEISGNISDSDHRHRQRAGLRRADFGDARFDRRVSVVHAALCEAGGELRGGNQIGGGGVEIKNRGKMKTVWLILAGAGRCRLHDKIKIADAGAAGVSRRPERGVETIAGHQRRRHGDRRGATSVRAVGRGADARAGDRDGKLCRRG